jgi:hypothetical protein
MGVPSSKQDPPITLWIWFREYLTKTYTVPALAWCTDNGGGLWGSSEYRVAVASQHCVMESTGGYKNSASNRKAETKVKACKFTTFSLLYMSGLARNYWCFAIMHATYLLNLWPRSDGCAPSSEERTGKCVDISDCGIFRLCTHAIIPHKRRANSDLALQTHSGTYLLASKVLPELLCWKTSNVASVMLIMSLSMSFSMILQWKIAVLQVIFSPV